MAGGYQAALIGGTQAGRSWRAVICSGATTTVLLVPPPSLSSSFLLYAVKLDSVYATSWAYHPLLHFWWWVSAHPIFVGPSDFPLTVQPLTPLRSQWGWFFLVYNAGGITYHA